ncbi:DUF6923 family protein [Leifsonia sp. SIMBA_070]|uniref:DUF6923 family protein n=3 Tax=Bacillati TaxID=1783272 RepID=UPI00397C234A
MTRAGKVAAALATAGLALGGLLAIGGPSDAAQAAPVGCSSGLIYTTGGSSQIWQRTPSGTDTLVATAAVLIGAVAQDPVTGNVYVFGMATGFKSHLYRAEADGTTTDLGPVAGLPNGPGNVFSAAFDHTGRLWVEFNTAPTQLYPVDVAALSSSGPLTVSTNLTNDIAELNGTMYSAGSNTLQRIDLTTGTVTSAPLSGVVFPTGPGLAAQDGHLYISTGTGFAEILNPTTATPTISAPFTTGLKFAVGDAAACATAGNPFLNAETDDLTGTTLYSGIGGTAGNVFVNDLLNGAGFQPGDVTPSVLTDGGLTGVAVAADGTLTVPAATPAGTYAVGYKICQTAIGRTAVCDTASATVRVTALPAVDAVDDDFTAAPVTAGTAGTAGNVFADDTVDGAAVSPAAVTATITADGGLTGAALTTAGDLTVPATAVPGTYTLAYQLCAVAPPTACDTATVTLRVVAATTPVPPPAAGTPVVASPVGPGVTAVTPVGDKLASTGSDLAAAAAGASLGGAVAIILGAALWLLARRRRAAQG